VTLVNFGLFAGIGGALGAYLVLARQIQAGMEPQEYALLAFGLIPLLVVVGSRVFVLALEWREFVASPLSTLRKPGFAFQGGFAAGTVGFVVLVWRHDLDPWLLADSFALAIPLGHAFGRIGCLTYGCCHGKPTRSRLAVRYTHPDSKVVRASGLGGVPLHPTQLYSASANLMIFVVLGALATRETHPGQLAGAYLLMEATGRFIMEFLRGIPTSRFLGLSPFQWVSVAVFAAGAAVLGIASTGQTLAPWSAGDLGRSLGEAATLWVYPLWVFGLFFVAFGVHGRQVGRV
jgi:phosphatidylglycerol:prolipoprotein diacylglycerol transferase